MSSKGSTNKTKRLNAPDVRLIQKKKRTWTIRTSPGPHRAQASVPLGVVLRELLAVSTNAKESRRILQSGQVQVNNRVRKDRQFPVGLLDSLHLKLSDAYYRMVFDAKGRLVAVETDAKDAQTGIEQVRFKKRIGPDQFQLTTNAGTTFKSKDASIRLGSSLVIDRQKKEIRQVLEFKKGNQAYVTGGTHVSTLATIEDISASTMKRPALVSLRAADQSFQTVAGNVLVVGANASLIRLNGESK